jgi:glycerol-3-phosphate dehydrogenase
MVDADGFNHIPHGPHSVFGTCRWSVVSRLDDQRLDPEEVERLWSLVSRFFPQIDRNQCETREWAGSTIQAMHVEQVEPGLAPMPTVIDHDQEPPLAPNLLSVFPGRATLWPQLAEETLKIVTAKLGGRTIEICQPPWKSTE